MRSLFAIAMAVAMSSAGCAGGDDDDDDDDDGGADFTESEPNDTFATANDVGAAVTFEGTCSAADDVDDFFTVVVAGSGETVVNVAYDEGDAAANDLDLALLDSSGDPIIEDITESPGDTPATVGNTGPATTYGIQVICFSTETGPADYVGTITRP